MLMYSILPLLLILGALSGFVLSYWRIRKTEESKTIDGKVQKSLIDYLLLWPLIVKRDSTTERIFSKREVAGWILLIALMIMAVVFRW
jgi:hypothetical protein